LIVLLIVIAVSAILLAVIFPAIMMSASPDNIRESQSDFGITGAAISDGGLSGILILVLILGGLLGLFAIVARVLFVVGLFVAGKDVRFATLAGVFDILSILVIIGSSAYFFMQSVSNPFLLIDSIRITQIISVIANTIYMIFASFALLSASKKFE
jgi:hypothetical protein